METSITTSSYDVIVIKHRNQTFKSTPFQVVFSEKALKVRQSKKNKNKDLQFYVNEELIDLPLRIDPSNGRIQFQKKYIRKTGVISDGSDFSDDQRLSNRSTSKEKGLTATGLKAESIEQLKNEQAPTKFWQFAWLFNSKSNPQPPAKIIEPSIGDEQSKLARIKEEPYQGQQSSKEPLFQLSLCGQSLSKMKKQTSRQQVEKMFYANKVEYKQFIKDPLGIISNSNLVVRIDNSLYTWQLGAAVLASKFAFGVEPGQHFADELVKAKNKKSWYSIFGSNNVTKLDIQQKQPPTLRPLNKLQQFQVIKWRKSPDSDMLEKMHLHPGQNKARIVLQTINGQTEEAQFKIFLWSENEQVVISDIDGTITKSDVIGQIKTNYIHKGVCLLYNEIYKRNYKILYMTARAIGQYGQTRRFLQKQVEQNGMKLPPGPLLMSPQGYYISFRREVIQKTPDQLKIKLLATVNEIFPNNKKPIIAGFGNRQTDTIAYLRIKIPPDRIFCISEKSIITNQQTKTFATTYVEMLQQIDDYFPHIYKPESSETSVIQTSKEKATEENDDEDLKVVRKLSHSQFYERSPRSSQGEQKPLFRSAGRSKSEEGEPQTTEDEAFLMWYQNEFEKQKKQK